MLLPQREFDTHQSRQKRLISTEQVLEFISQGLSQTDALSLVGVAYSTWNGWMKNDPNLVADIKRAEISLKIKHLQNIQRHSENDVRASQWLLARKFPSEFGEKQTIDMNTRGDDSKVIIPIATLNLSTDSTPSQIFAAIYDRFVAILKNN